MSESALLPCPFCGTEPRISLMRDESLWSHDEVVKTAVRCGGCDVSTDYTEEGQDPEAIEKWNTRTHLEAREAVTAELVMSEAKHTAGPWSPRFDETYSIREADGGQLAILTNLRGAHGLAGRRASDEVAANARLIAAAPDLLAFAQWLLERYHSDEGMPEAKEIAREARAAIAKAQGSQHG